VDKKLFIKKKKVKNISAGASGIKKQYIKSRSSCKVTFSLPREAVKGAERVAVVGEFNGWDAGAHLLNKLRNGSFSAVIELPSGGTYRFRYLIDNTRWENDWYAGLYMPNGFGDDDSVVIV
jgi:hypothetical protein